MLRTAHLDSALGIIPSFCRICWRFAIDLVAKKPIYAWTESPGMSIGLPQARLRAGPRRKSLLVASVERTRLAVAGRTSMRAWRNW